MHQHESYEMIRVCMDVGSTKHYVVVGKSDGLRICEFFLDHTPTDIQGFFQKLEMLERELRLPIAIAMEGYNGHVRPIDQMALEKGYKVFSINNLKLNRFKEIFPGPAKSDPIDARKMLELWQMGDSVPAARNIMQEVYPTPEENSKLKWLTRRRRELIQEKIRITNRLGSELQAMTPGLLEITGQLDALWFLRFLSARENLLQLARLQPKTLMKIKGVGKKFCERIQKWQKTASFGLGADWGGEAVSRDARKVLELLSEINELERRIDIHLEESDIGQRLLSIDGCGPISAAELSGEIGTLSRFTSERGLALYVGVAPLSFSSGKQIGARSARQVNKRAKSAIHTIAWHHIQQNPQAKQYYDKKIAEGKKHNLAVRAFARHLIRVIWSMLRKKRDYLSQEVETETHLIKAG